MINRAVLSAQETSLINHICNLQLSSLESIINREIENDITTYCLKLGIEEPEFEHHVKIAIENYKAIKDYPDLIFTLNADQISIVKTIMGHIRGYGAGKAGLWRKFNIIERLEYYYSLN